MTEQRDNLKDSYDKVTSIVDKLETLKYSGQEAFASKDYEAAVEYFSNALQLMIEEMNIDSLHISLAPLYLAYGNALLQAAIQKSSDRLVNTELVPSEMVQTLVPGMDQKENRAQVIDFGDELSEDEEVEEEEDLINPQVQTEEGEEDQQPQEEDDFGIAWDVLDTARVIYERDASLSPSIRASKLVDVYCLLGDLSMENETFEQAIPDYGNAIENQKIMGETSIDEKRALASLFFKQAMAYEYSNNKTVAIETLTKAKELLESCIHELQSQDGKESIGDYDPLADLQSLIPEISEKIQELRNNGGGVEKNQLGLPSDKADIMGAPVVNDLSSLIKKRKSDADTTEDKHPKQEKQE